MKRPHKSRYYTPPKPRGLDDVVDDFVAFVSEYLETFGEPPKLYLATRKFYGSIYHYGGHLPDILRILQDEGRIRVILQPDGSRIIAPGIVRPGRPGSQ